MVDDPQKMLGTSQAGAVDHRAAVEEEFDGWLGRARDQRRPERERGLKNYEAGLRNGLAPASADRRGRA